MPEPFLSSLFFLADLYVCVIIHEAGHALVGMASGFVVTSVGLGSGAPFLVLPIGRTRLYLGLTQPLQGITFAFLPRPYTDRRRLAAFIAGGVAANALCAVASLSVALFLPTGRPATLLGMFASVNALIAALSLVPVRFRVGGAMFRSDGMLLLAILRDRSLALPPPEVIQSGQGNRRLWRSVGDRLMDRLFTLSAGLAWIDLGSPAKAETLLTEAVAIDAADPYLDWLEAVTRTNLALAKGDLSGASDALTHAENLGKTAGAEERYLLALLGATLLLEEGKQGEALAAFEQLSADPLGQARPELGLSTLTGYLRAASAAGDDAALSVLRARYEAVRLDYPSEVRDLHAYRTLARFASSRGGDARDDYRRASKAVASLASPWRDANDRNAFVDAQAELIDEARQALGAEIAEPFIVAVEAQQPDDGFLDRQALCRRWALRAMLVNAVSFIPLLLIALDMRPRGAPVLILAVLLALSTFLGVVWLMLDFVAGKLLPSLRKPSGTILLSLAVMPWLGELMSFVVSVVTP